MNKRIALLTVVLASLSLPLVAEDRGFLDGGKIVPVKDGKGIFATVKSLGSKSGVWVAYTVPMIKGNHELCCGDWRNSHFRESGCRLDGGSYSIHSEDRPVSPVENRRMQVLVRLDKGKVAKVRSFNESCNIDADGSTIYTLDSVSTGESVSFLSRQVLGSTGGWDRHDDATTSIAFHAGDAALDALRGFATDAEKGRVRGLAAFWLANRDGDTAIPLLMKMVREDPSDHAREQAVFAISIADTPESVPTLIELARHAERRSIRGKAIFWLSQKAGDRAVDAIRDAVDDDPEVEVRKEAVFALSQLPRERGVPLLIDIARSNRHPEVRKAAIFWLGQSDDGRALDFFEEILTN